MADRPHRLGPIPWLTDPFWAKVLVILAITWRWTGYNMIFYLAALQNIDRSIYEAARIDGVPAWARFWLPHYPDAEAGDPVHHRSSRPSARCSSSTRSITSPKAAAARPIRR